MAVFQFPPIVITLADGSSVRADIWPADLYRLEEHSDISLTSLGSNVSFRHLLPLAWFSLRRSQQIPIDWTLEDFVNKVKDFDLVTDAAGPKDISPTPPTG